MKRITKSTARKLYSEKKSFWMTACNMRPEFGAFIGSPSYDYETTDWTFDQLVNAFTYYNCNNERGRYPAYYVEE